uniref:Carbohydrate sulfotransferase n=1 Tax=Rhizochromulina marina TaxID=1034831 RepID=A0A7S2RWM4_9STRA|mmetsp:Transcript_22106/g.64152  ORF Transcript_22106/g.64152 Transcript_22106/m.64152 type:complete len:234 (+) Transcript_22106:84-785(+)
MDKGLRCDLDAVDRDDAAGAARLKRMLAFQDAGNDEWLFEPPPGGRGPTCGCNFWHIPPRFQRRRLWNPGNVSLFCVVREPLDRALSEFKMRHKNAVGDVAAAEDFLVNLVKRYARNPASSDCHLVPQFLYIWGQEGRRTCHHVIHYEDGLNAQLEALMAAYDIAWPPSRGMNKISHHPPSSVSPSDIAPDIAALVRAVYWKDMCLLGYRPDGSAMVRVRPVRRGHGRGTKPR